MKPNAAKRGSAARRRSVVLPTAEVRGAAHAALDGLLDLGCSTFLLHGEVGRTTYSVTVPPSEALAHGIAASVYEAWFEKKED